MYLILDFMMMSHINCFLIFSFTYNSKYYETRQLASELGVGDDNDWIYEDDDDWVTLD